MPVSITGAILNFAFPDYIIPNLIKINSIFWPLTTFYFKVTVLILLKLAAEPNVMTQFFYQAGQEVVFYQDANGVTITSLRAILGSRVFVLANITSTRAAEIAPPRIYPSGLMALSILLLFYGTSQLATNSTIGFSNIAGAILGLVGSFVWFTLQKSTYALKIGTAGGEINGKVSDDQDYIMRINEALNRALVYRR